MICVFDLEGTICSKGESTGNPRGQVPWLIYGIRAKVPVPMVLIGTKRKGRIAEKS